MPSFARPFETSETTRGAPLARADAAYEYLRESLLEGPLVAGERLSVVELTRVLGCSRVPVMEAMKRLASEGFVRIVPQVGCHVVTPRFEDVRDFFVLFAAVESTVTGFAAARRDAADVAELEQVCDRIAAELPRAKGPGEPDPTYRRLNLLFYTCLHRMARSPVSSGIARSLWDRSDFYIKLAFGSLYFSKRVRRAHAAISAAVIAGDSPGAQAAVRAHLLAVGEGVAARFAS
ncbi:MAG: GntR family transcriptional regulator [Gammaproteobacteria bacterium]